MIKNTIIAKGIVLLFSLSFWSSGVFLIRILHTYHVWDGGIPLAFLFMLSIPLGYLSIMSVRSMWRVIGQEASTPTHYIIALVLLLHAAALSLYPGLYALVPSEALSAAAWLLWFGGSAMVISRMTGR